MDANDQKTIDKEKRATFDLYSHTLLPMFIPKYNTNKEKRIIKTSKVLALSITILNKNNKYSFRSSRILASVVSAMQNVFEDTYISPIEQDPSTPIIYNVNDIPTESGNIKDYIATPIYGKKEIFMGKIYILTNHPINDY
jgi:hypothetical protein